jgi:hypothetical protein
MREVKSKREIVLPIQIVNDTQEQQTVELFGSCSNIGKELPKGVDIINLCGATYSEVLYYMLSEKMIVNAIRIETDKVDNFEHEIILKRKSIFKGLTTTYDFKKIKEYYQEGQQRFDIVEFKHLATITSSTSMIITIEPKSTLTLTFYSVDKTKEEYKETDLFRDGFVKCNFD